MNQTRNASNFGSGLSGIVTDGKLAVLNVPDYNLIATKNPRGSYDRRTRENLYWVIEKLQVDPVKLTTLERRLLEKFGNANFAALEEKEKRVKFEVARYRLSQRVKQSIKLVATTFFILIFAGWLVYQFGVNSETRQEIDIAYYAGLKQLGLVSRKDFENIRDSYTATSLKLAETKKNYMEVSQRIEQMIQNNQVTENFQHILKQIYLDPRTKYVTRKDNVALLFNGREVARYKTDPKLWYILGIIETGGIRVYYDDQEILEIDTILDVWESKPRLANIKS